MKPAADPHAENLTHDQAVEEIAKTLWRQEGMGPWPMRKQIPMQETYRTRAREILRIVADLLCADVDWPTPAQVKGGRAPIAALCWACILRILDPLALAGKHETHSTAASS